MLNDHHRPTELDGIERDAVAWVQKLLTGEVTAEEAQALRRWRATSPAHMAAFVRASETWRKAGAAGRVLRDGGGELAIGLSQVAHRQQMMTRRAWIGGSAAAVLAAAGYGAMRPPLGLWPSVAELSADYRTGTGEQRAVTLAGDVSVNMNTQTSIAFRTSQHDAERLELIAGEASFTTAARQVRPLVVIAGAGETRTEAATFDIRCLRNNGDATVSVTCFTGVVEVAHQDKTIELGAGRRLRYGHSGVSDVMSVDAESASNWQRGVVVFHGTPLVEAVDEINRYRPGRIIIANNALGQKHISGRFRIDEMGNVLTRLQQAFGANVRALPGGLVLLS
jgi:transmembrane sensor